MVDAFMLTLWGSMLWLFGPVTSAVIVSAVLLVALFALCCWLAANLY